MFKLIFEKHSKLDELKIEKIASIDQKKCGKGLAAKYDDVNRKAV